jgi:5-formyltetrahydrofolate cyclo-ligase
MNSPPSANDPVNDRQAKAELRSAILAWRSGLTDEERQAASEALLASFHRERPFKVPTIVSAFWPIKDELDIRPLLMELHFEGCQVALPVVVEKGKPLTFRAWRPGDVLEPGVFGTLQPTDKRDIVEPDVLICPLLACDDHGWRLGYGGGFYDRTLAALRLRKRIVAMGVAFDDQLVPDVPDDQRLDWLLTDKRACAFV